ncbi:MAG: VWA-like domain-containing protein [Pigmentiphaga sp.]|nr:VWA-like domain-containing protein [Pigmentiphaga sp.]
MKAILQARAALVFDSPFFGALALRLKLQEDATCKTAWTDGAAIGYNPDFVASLSASELAGLLAHEVMHVAAGHPWRRDGRDAKRWNIACDYAINGELAAAGFQLPAGALLDSQYTGKAAEWIYDRLPASEDGNGAGSGSGGAGEPAGEVRDAPAPEDGAPSEEEWRQAVQQAANVAKARGNLPDSLDRFAKAAAAPAVDWKSVLARFAQESAKADYSWSRPNSRYLPRGLYLPALRSVAMGRIAVAVDTSGSVDDVLLAQFSAEISAIAAELAPEAIDVLYCDRRINRRETFEAGEPVKLSACGGGGTDFRPVFEALEGEDAPACLVYLTDLDGPFPASAPDYPVLWAATSHDVAPFGETVRMF